MTHPAPAEPAAHGSLPDALTFFLTRDQRRAVLRRLNTPAPNRTQALLRALGLTPNRFTTEFTESTEHTEKEQVNVARFPLSSSTNPPSAPSA